MMPPYWNAVLDAVKTTFVAALAYSCGIYFTRFFHDASSLIGGLWAMISGISVLSARRNAIWRFAGPQIIGTLFGAVVSAIYLTFLPFSPLGLTLSIFATVLLCHAAGVPDHARLAVATVALIMVLSSIHPGVHPALSAALRLSEACIGVVVAALTIMLWPQPKE